MNTEVMFSSNKDDWETPQELFNILNSEFHFDLDVCANELNFKVQRFFSKAEDGLEQSWQGKTCWCNPPYGREIGKWVEKAYKESCDNETKVVMLLPARTDTRWFHDYCKYAKEIRFIKGRLKFSGSKNAAPFPSMIVVFGDHDNSLCKMSFGDVRKDI